MKKTQNNWWLTMSHKFDDFEVLTSGNSKLMEAISYVKENVDKKILKKLKKNGLVNDENSTASLVTDVMELMSASNTSPLFRKTHNANAFLTNIWLSKVQESAKKKLILSEQKKSYKALSIDALYTIAKQSSDIANLKKIDKYLYDKHGIILTYISNIEGMRTDAVTFILETGNPIIGMSLRFKRYDNFWFTLMHELAHIFLHLDKMTEPHLDDLEDKEKNKEEIEVEANALAKELLAPRRIWSKCNARKDFKRKSLLEFSKKYEIHPAIIAGFIRFDNENHTIFSKIVHAIDVRNELKGFI